MDFLASGKPGSVKSGTLVSALAALVWKDTSSTYQLLADKEVLARNRSNTDCPS